MTVPPGIKSVVLHAGTDCTAAYFFAVVVQVIRGERVTSPTKIARLVSNASTQILRNSDGLQMSRVDATTDPTKMI
jgi:hypothetical protein